MNLLIDIAALLVICGVLWISFDQMKFGVPPMPTMPWVRRVMLAEIPAGATGRIVELGSGWGSLAIAAARQNPQATVTGYEASVLPLLVSRLRGKLSGLENLSFQRRDFFNVPLNDAQYVLAYLTNALMAKLRWKFMQELPENALVISSTFFIPDWPEERVIEAKGLWTVKVHVYRKGFKT